MVIWGPGKDLQDRPFPGLRLAPPGPGPGALLPGTTQGIAMIVSASYRTDIPAFYGRWFLNRLRAGLCRTVNPYGRQVSTVPLTPEAVDGFVFWTRNIAPFRKALAEVADRGFPFVVQMTATGYPRALETSVMDRRPAAAQMRELARDFGPYAVVWRYDPVISTSLTPADWHIANFAKMAEALEGATDEAVISFAHSYAKTKRNMDQAARAHGFTWEDPDIPWKREMAGRLADIAGRHGMKLTICAQPEFAGQETCEARCIDAARLSRVAGRPIAAKQKGNRPGCACFESRDIGDYDSCPHGCVYCYAVRSRDLAKARFARHDPESEFLIEPEAPQVYAAR